MISAPCGAGLSGNSTTRPACRRARGPTSGRLTASRIRRRARSSRRSSMLHSRSLRVQLLPSSAPARTRTICDTRFRSAPDRSRSMLANIAPFSMHPVVERKLKQRFGRDRCPSGTSGPLRSSNRFARGQPVRRRNRVTGVDETGVEERRPQLEAPRHAHGIAVAQQLVAHVARQLEAADRVLGVGSHRLVVRRPSSIGTRRSLPEYRSASTRGLARVKMPRKVAYGRRQARRLRQAGRRRRRQRGSPRRSSTFRRAAAAAPNGPRRRFHARSRGTSRTSE